MSTTTSPRSLFLGALGGLIGGVAGYFIVGWLLRWGFYGMMIPGAALGLGVGWCSGERSAVLGVLAGVAALGLGLYTEWHYFPFKAEPSFSFFLKNVHNLTPVSQIMIVLGAICAYWFGQGRERFVRRPSESDGTGEESGSSRSTG
jgi:hypothetical protein